MIGAEQKYKTFNGGERDTMCGNKRFIEVEDDTEKHIISVEDILEVVVSKDHFSSIFFAMRGSGDIYLEFDKESDNEAMWKKITNELNGPKIGPAMG